MRCVLYHPSIFHTRDSLVYDHHPLQTPDSSPLVHATKSAQFQFQPNPPSDLAAGNDRYLSQRLPPQFQPRLALPIPQTDRSLEHLLPLNPLGSRLRPQSISPRLSKRARTRLGVTSQLPSIIPVSGNVGRYPALCDVPSPRWASPPSRYSMTVRIHPRAQGPWVLVLRTSR